MRSFASALATAATIALVAAVPRVDVDNCDSGIGSNGLYTVTAAAGSAWACADFVITPRAGKLIRMNVPGSLKGYNLQVAVYNKELDNAGTGEVMWTTAASGFIDYSLPQVGAKDENALPTAWSEAAYDNYTDGTLSLAPIAAYTGSNHQTNGVYAYRGQLAALNPGTTTLIFRYPSRAATSGAQFRGVFMYRFVNPNIRNTDIVDQFNGGTLSSEAIAADIGSLSVGGTVTLSDVLMPGDSVSIPIAEQFASIGYALRGLKYEVTLQQVLRAGTPTNLATPDLGWNTKLNVPTGYATIDNTEKSYNTDTGAIKPTYQVSDGGTTQGFYYDYSSQWGPYNGTIAYGTNTITREWNYPIDRTALTSDDSVLSITVPTPINVLDPTRQVVAWDDQSTPFWTLSVRLVRVDTYPMFGAESGVTLKNYDTDEDNGHSLSSPVGQTPFKLYMARISSPMWWRALPSFSGLQNLNKVADGAVSDGCQPRVDVQVINRAGAKFMNGWMPNNDKSVWKSIEESFNSGLVTGVSSEDFYPEGVYAQVGTSDMQSQTPALVNTKWYNPSANAPASSLDNMVYALGTVEQSFDDLWLMVRVSAARRTLMQAANPGYDPVAASCGSNNVMIGSMGLLVDTVQGQCGSYKDCMVGKGNPNEDQKDDSANKDGTRFANCYFKRTVGPNYVSVPTTKCMECNTDQHCKGGQYCHMDDGICGYGSNRFYNCDSKSGALYGVCREKSKDVLGKKCRQPSRSRNGGFSTSMDVVGSAGAGGFAGASRVSTFQNGYGAAISSENSFSSALIRSGDADDDKAAKGAFGACGEYAFYTASPPNGGSVSGAPRGALWQGFCSADQVCMECIPGETMGYGSSGVTCLNGKMYSAMDVDGTVRTFAENTAAGSILGTTTMIILLVVLFSVYMVAETRRHREAHGLPDMSCCECLLCCGACSSVDPPAKKTSNPVAA